MNFFTKVFVSPIKEIKEAFNKKRKDGVNENEFELQTARPGSSRPFLPDKQRAVNDLEEIHSKCETAQSEIEYELLLSVFTLWKIKAYSTKIHQHEDIYINRLPPLIRDAILYKDKLNN